VVVHEAVPYGIGEILPAILFIQKVVTNNAMSSKIILVDSYAAHLKPMETSAVPDHVSDLLPDYRITCILGRGGFATVYGAKGLHGKEVALKLPTMAVACETLDDAIYRTFNSEADIWKKLRHPNIVEIFESNIQPLPYITMERMEGGSLRRLLEIRELMLGEVLNIMIPVLDGLSYAHRMATIHRDLKPENILFTKEGIPKITDWGIGKFLAGGAATQTYVSKGTFTYSAPEQFDSQSFGKVDWQTDIFQIGVMLYEMLSGENPFQGDDMAQVLGNVINHEPESLCSLDQSIPPELDSIVMKALSKRKEERWGSADVMLYGIRQLAEGKPITVDLSRGDGVGKGEGEKHAGWKVPEGAGRANTCPECGNYITPENRKLRCKSCQGYVCQECESWIDKEESYRGFHLHMRYPLCEECYLMELVNHKDHIGELVEEDERKKREASMREQRKREWEKWYGLVTPGNAVERQNIWAETMDVPVNYTDIFGTEFVLIPPGEFFMGSPTWEDTRPMHKVRIEKVFYMGVCPVTQGLWEKIMKMNPSHFKRGAVFKEGPLKMRTRPLHPVESVSYFDCGRFLEQINEMDPTVRYRLPTEAEWEYAARAGSTGNYTFDGDSAYQLAEYACISESSWGSTQPVGTRKKNQWGLHDVHGNVWEWCSDIYDPTYYSLSTPVDPTGPIHGVFRAMRGGSWDSLYNTTSLAYRGSQSPKRRRRTIGLRLVCEIKKLNRVFERVTRPGKKKKKKKKK